MYAGITGYIQFIIAKTFHMQKIFLTCLLLLSAAFMSAQTTSNVSVFFDPDQSELSREASVALDALAADLLEAPDYSLMIEAYTDDRGTETYNLRLAGSRAEAVQQYLLQKGLQSGKTSVKSWGEQNLAFDNATEENRRKNRRVDIVATFFNFTGMADLQNRLSSSGEQIITIQPDRNQQFTAAGGTVVVIPAQSFVFEDGSAPRGPVAITVREAYDPADWITHNLTTMSDGRLLQTGGMVYLDAQSDGKPLTLATGALLTVAMPAKNIDPGMELFYSSPGADGSVNWQPVGQSFRQTLKDDEVKLDIDPSLSARIMALRAPISPKPTVPSYSGDIPPEPRMPNAPRPPYPPRKPEWEDIQFRFGSRSGEAMNRKGSKKARKFYQEALARYNRDSADYVKLYDKYLVKVTNFEAAKERYATEHQNWEMELKGRIRRVMDYEREQYLHIYSNGLQLAVKQIGKNIGKYENYSNLEYAVRDAADINYRQRQREEFFNQSRDRVVISDLYYKCIGHKVVDGLAFRDLFSQVKYTYPSDTLQRAIAGILKDMGIRAISDSLKTEIKERQLLVAKSPDQARRYMRAYVADITRLGWINCDKFYNDPSEKVQLVVNEAEDATMYVVCKDISSVLTCYPSGQGAYIATGIPKGRKVSVISIKLKDGKAQFAMRDVRAGESPALDLSYKSLSVKELREELKRINI